MMHASVGTLRFVALLLIVITAFTGVAAANPPADPSLPPAPASTDARTKIHPKLLADIDARLQQTGAPQAPNAPGAPAVAAQPIPFIARIKAGTDLSPFTSAWFARPYVDPLGATVAFGYAGPVALLKMATLAEVITLQRPESLAHPPTPVQPGVPPLNATAQLPAATPDIPTPQGWYDAGPSIHRSEQAWAKGYTGKGVRYMVNDSGADYCHPDIFGTWAYIENPQSPYYGLPQMFDSYSALLAARDFSLGETNIARGFSDYADTSQTVSAPATTFSYEPIGALFPHTYTLPLTGISKSGVYHYGSHPDRALATKAGVLSSAYGDGSAFYGERATILVVDANTAGVYDTVYVDLNYNFDFNDDKPAVLARDFKNREAACRDTNGDGLNDVSGGLVYFIADGQTAVPTLDWYWGIPGTRFGNGSLVAFHVMDFVEDPIAHGMGCTSSAVGQGVVRGSVSLGPTGPPVAGGRGLVVGPGKELKTVQNGNFYLSPLDEDAFIFAGLGYDGIAGNDDDIQIVSNSWGFGGVDNEGLDYTSRLFDAINRLLAPRTTILFSAGNDGPAYGSLGGPFPASSIGVGASTVYDQVGSFESIASAEQIVGGDVMTWSARGPSALATNGVDVLATGAWASGSVPLNQNLDGAISTNVFGGTSQAAPVAAGNLALIYQAWRARSGEWPTFAQAKALLMGSARNANHDVFTQGAGLVDAERGVTVAAGQGGVYTTPAAWAAGSYRGQDYPAFPHIIASGAIDRQTFTLWNHSPAPQQVTLDSFQFQRSGERDYSFRTLDQALDHGQFTVPDYVFRIDQDIPQGTELLQIRVSKPYNQFDPDNDQFEFFNDWEVMVYNWTDLNGDGRFWVDANGNGKVDATGEMQTGEYIRFSYGYNSGPTQHVRVANPLQRKASGILLGFRHRSTMQEVPRTDLIVQASFWQRTDWDWLDVPSGPLLIPPGGSATFDARMRVPRGIPPGMYEGSIGVITNDNGGSRETVIPVTAAVAVPGTSFKLGTDGQSQYLYDNGRLFGYTDYTGFTEAGDWRFFWTDIAAADLPAGSASYLVVDTSWPGRLSDIDTLVFGPQPDCFSNGKNCQGRISSATGAPEIYGPYTLGLAGSSINTYLRDGRWGFETSSGRRREVVAVPAREGLHSIVLHQVKTDGSRLSDHISGTVGRLTLTPGVVESAVTDITINSQVNLDGIRARAYGLSQPLAQTGTVLQDDPGNPASASFQTTVTLTNAASLDITLSGSVPNDIDLYVLGPDETLVGASYSLTANEQVTLALPRDGTYTILVFGYRVPSGSITFNLNINAIQGLDLTVSGLPSQLAAGAMGRFSVRANTAGKPAGTYDGLLVIGTSAAPNLLNVPVKITVP